MLWLLLQLLHQPGEKLFYGCRASQETVTCLQLLWLLESPSRLLTGALPTLGSANSVSCMNGKKTGITNKISKTLHHKGATA